MARSSRTRATALLLTGVLMGALATTTSRAAPSDAVERARQLFVQAEADEDAERWSEAIDKFHAVAQVKPTAGVRYHIALCEERLGQLARALGDYRAAEDQARLESAKDVLLVVGKQLASLEPRVPRLTIRVTPAIADASVKLDGEPVAVPRIGAVLAVDPGVHRVEFTAPASAASTTVVTLQEYESRVLDVGPGANGPATPTSTSTSTSTATPTPTPTPTSSLTATATATATSTPAGRFRGGAIVATGIAIAFAGGGAAAYLAAGAEHQHAVTACAATASSAADPCAWLKNRVRTWDWVAAGAWGGALTAGVLAILFWTKPSVPSRSAGANLVVGPAAVGVRGWF